MPQADKTSTQNSKLKTSNKTTTNPRTSKTVESHGSESSSNLSVSQYNNHNNSSNTNNTNTKKTPNTDSTGQTTTSVGNSSSQGFDQLNVPPREDSGTESGEDLRLIAAGIRDKLHMQSDTNLIQEVTTALNRLESSLKEGKDLSLDEKKRNALLALVARLQTGLTSPEKLADTLMSATAEAANANANEVNYEETSSPEADAHRSNRQRFAKRRNRNSRHTVGVSREELEDARRYMEDVLMMGNISNSTTPDSSVAPVTPPNWFPLEKNASSGAILTSQPLNLYRPNQFVPSNLKSSTENLKADPTLSSKESPIRKDSTKRPLSGDYSVSFVQANATAERSAYGGSGYNPPPKEMALQPAPIFPNQSSGDSSFKSNRFSNKKVLMKRANTIDIPKTKNYNPEFETDSEVEDKGPTLGLKRAVQVSVKQRVRNVVPPFEPKTENDHKFLAFINKQSPKHGLGWNSSKSVSNWTNKFGSIKHTFEVGAAATVTTGKPPQVPGHTPLNAAKNYWNKNASQQQAYDEAMAANAQLQRSQQEATERRRRLERERMERDRLEREHMERMRAEQLRKERIERERLEREYYEREKMEKERLERERYEMERFERERFERERFERERYERDRMDRERMERDRLERERLERERLERQIMERDRLERDRLERERMEKERLEREILARERSRAVQYSSTPDISLSGHPSPIVNKFIHAPQSVFRPIDGNGSLKQNVFKPINGSHSKPNTWQPPESAYHPLKSNVVSESPQYLTAKSSVSNSSSPIATSPIGLPWVSKSADKSALRSKASKFEDKSPYDQRNSQNLHRHNSLRSNNANQQQLEQARKRPSLPNTADPYLLSNAYQPNSSYFASAAFPPAPTNISFTYADYTPATNYQSYPCLPSAVTSMDRTPQCREDSLTNPQAEPLVLSSAKPLYTPQTESLQAPPPSNYQRQFDYASPLDSTPTSPSFMSMPPTDCTDDDLDSDSNIMEYRVESKVMGKPQSQTAVRVGRRTNHVSDDEVYGKNSRQARNLLHTMKNLGSNNGEQKIGARGMPTKPPSPKVCISPDGRSYQAPIVEPLFPQITNFEPNRSPMYVGMNSPKSTSMQSLPTQYQQNPTYIPPTIDPSPYQQPPMPRSNPQKIMYQQQAQTTGQMTQQRNRNISENSTSSKLSNNSHPAYVNTVTTGSSWDGNAMYADEMRREMPSRTQFNMDPMPSQYHTQQMSQGQPIEQHQQQPVMSKPELRPKPQLAPLNVRQASVASQPPTQVAPNYQQQTQSSPLQPMEKPKAVLNPSGMSSKPTDTTFRRQNTIDSGVFESRRNSQQSQQTQEQQQQQQQLAVEMRRKSLGNAVEIQQQNRKSTAFETQCEYTQRSKQQEYKSSAPPDTPDIVKSSLPKDENVPILKKFGPPQRHHYIPNAYQSPTQSQTQTHTKRIESSTKVKATSQKVIQHSSVVSKPTIVETPATPQLQSESTEDLIPRNIVFNNVSAFTSMSRRSDMDHSHLDHDHRTPNKLSKSDSWSQIVQQQSQYQQSISSAPKFNSGAGGNELRRTKSGHSLAVPKMFEAGIDKSQVTEKQRTVAAYFSGNKSPNAAARQGEDDESKVVTRKSAINRTKTTQKVSTSRKSLSSLSAINGAVTGGGGGLARSATMPHIANVSLLDESNVEDAFEQLMMGS